MATTMPGPRLVALPVVWVYDLAAARAFTPPSALFSSLGMAPAIVLELGNMTPPSSQLLDSSHFNPFQAV